MTTLSKMEFLPNFVFMTNFCEGRGYEVKNIPVSDGFRCDIYYHKELQRRGKKIFKSCIDAQKASYSAIYRLLRKSEKTT